MRRIGSERFLRPRPHPRGYSLVSLSRGGHYTSYTVHRLVAEAFLGRRLPSRQINHRNGIKTDNRLLNLEWVTPKQNGRHARTVLRYRR